MLPMTPYVRWIHLRTDPIDQMTYTIVSHIPSGYFTNANIPTYSGNFSREYHHVCPPIDNRTLAREFYLGKMSTNYYWQNPTVTDWYAGLFGREKIYNTSFVNDITSDADKTTYNLSMKMLSTFLKTTTDFSLMPARETLKVSFKAYELFLQRLNTSATAVQDYMSIRDLAKKKLEIVSWLPFFRQSLETFSLNKPQEFAQIVDTSYLNSTIGLKFQQLVSPRIPEIDQKIDELLKPHILKFLSLASF